jgi:hypothetical protein
MTEEEFKEKLDGYLKSKGSYNRCKQIQAVFLRRLLVFTREPKQWIMIVGPFCFVIIIAFLIFALVQAIFVTVEDIDKKPAEPEEGDDDETSTKVF